MRLVVLALAVAGTGPLEELREWQDDPAEATATAARGVSADPETSLVTRRVPEAGSAATSADERRRFRAAGLPPRVVAELESTRAQEYGLLGVTWERGTAAKDLVVQVRTRTGEEWTSWEDLEIEDIQKGESAATRAGTNPTWVGESDGVAVRLLSAHDAPEDVQVALIDGGTGLSRACWLQVGSGAGPHDRRSGHHDRRHWRRDGFHHRRDSRHHSRR